MEISQPNSNTSIFDFIEINSAQPNIFNWISSEPSLYNPEEFLFEGELIEFADANSDSYKIRKYQLFQNYFIKYRVKSKFQPKSHLLLKNPRLIQINEPRVITAENEKSKRFYGFELVGYKGSFRFYTEEIAQYTQWIEVLKCVCILQNISHEYTFGSLIGKGDSAKVHSARRKIDDTKFAIKSIKKRILAKNLRRLNFLNREINIMRSLDHPYIVRLYEVYENEIYIHLVCEYLSGGELFSLLQTKVKFSESVSMQVMKCLLEALSYIHSKGIIHRDIKPENLILVNPKNNYTIKIADLGLAIVSGPIGKERSKCGSPGYVAPEILNNVPYDSKADIFSAGIILYIMLTGNAPFRGVSFKEILARNTVGFVSFPFDLWENVNPLAKDLAQKMTTLNPEKRPNALDCLKHELFMNSRTESVVWPSSLLESFNESKLEIENNESSNNYSELETSAELDNKIFEHTMKPHLDIKTGNIYRRFSIGETPATCYTGNKVSEIRQKEENNKNEHSLDALNTIAAGLKNSQKEEKIVTSMMAEESEDTTFAMNSVVLDKCKSSTDMDGGYVVKGCNIKPEIKMTKGFMITNKIRKFLKNSI